MVNYQESKIYKIVCNTTGLVYYGSTTRDLRIRLCDHIGKAKKAKEIGKMICSSCKVIENDNYEIILIENYSCNNQQELRIRENFYIVNNECVNKYIPTRTCNDYYKDKKEQICNQHKEYRAKNLEMIREKDRIRREINKEEINKNNRENYEKNKEEINNRNKEYRENNKEEFNKKRREYYQKNKEKINNKNKEYQEKNKEELKIYRKEKYQKNKKERQEKSIVII